MKTEEQTVSATIGKPDVEVTRGRSLKIKVLYYLLSLAFILWIGSLLAIMGSINGSGFSSTVDGSMPTFLITAGLASSVCLYRGWDIMRKIPPKMKINRKEANLLPSIRQVQVVHPLSNTSAEKPHQETSSLPIA